MAISPLQIIDCIRLARSENVGPKTFQSLMDLYGNPSVALEAIPGMAAKGGRQKPIRLCSKAQVEQEIEASAKKGAALITILQPEYPKLLRQISDYPPVITVLGDARIMHCPSIALVGARNASANGCRFTQALCGELGRYGYVVTSGLARGIDTAAHQGALATGTVAVVAGGIDTIYPPENKNLFEAIGKNGAVVTEMPYGAVPKAQHFPRRNRIISGLSRAVVVVEASLNSGSLITARMALEQGRDVFAVPGSPLDPRCAGTNGLLKQGAQILTQAEDILHAFGRADQGDLLLEEPDAPFSTSRPVRVDDRELDQARPKIIEKIGCSPTLVDDIISQTGFPPHLVLAVLVELELAGRLDRHWGNKVSLVQAEEVLL